MEQAFARENDELLEKLEALTSSTKDLNTQQDKLNRKREKLENACKELNTEREVYKEMKNKRQKISVAITSEKCKLEPLREINVEQERQTINLEIAAIHKNKGKLLDRLNEKFDLARQGLYDRTITQIEFSKVNADLVVARQQGKDEQEELQTAKLAAQGGLYN